MKKTKKNIERQEEKEHWMAKESHVFLTYNVSQEALNKENP